MSKVEITVGAFEHPMGKLVVKRSEDFITVTFFPNNERMYYDWKWHVDKGFDGTGTGFLPDSDVKVTT